MTMKTHMVSKGPADPNETALGGLAPAAAPRIEDKGTRKQEPATRGKAPAPPITINSTVQTDELHLLNYACDLFLQELKRTIEEELKSNEEGVFQDLLKKAMYIINRIKSKAATAGGAIGGGAIASAVLPASSPAIVGSLPMSPVIGNQRQLSPPKSWHFDVSNTGQSEQQRRILSRGSNIKNISP